MKGPGAGETSAPGPEIRCKAGFGIECRLGLHLEMKVLAGYLSIPLLSGNAVWDYMVKRPEKGERVRTPPPAISRGACESMNRRLLSRCNRALGLSRSAWQR